MSDNRTTELRAKLTERGVKWWPMCNNGYYEERDTEFVANGKKHTAHEWGDGLAVYNLTPEQAIAATLEKENAMLETTLALARGSLDVAATHEVEKDRLIADLTQLVLDMHAHPCKGFVNCPSNGCQWWSAKRKKCQIGERMRDLGIAEFGVPWKVER